MAALAAADSREEEEEVFPEEGAEVFPAEAEGGIDKSSPANGPTRSLPVLIPVTRDPDGPLPAGFSSNHQRNSMPHLFPQGENCLQIEKQGQRIELHKIVLIFLGDLSRLLPDA